MQNHFETFSRKRAIYAKTSCVKRGLFCNYNFSAHTKAAVQRAVLYLSPRRPRRLKDETAECKYRGSRRSNPCVNSSDSTSVRKKSTTPPPTGPGMFGIRLTRWWCATRRVVLMNLYDRRGRSPQERVEKVIGGGCRLTGHKIREELEILSIRCFECRREEFYSHAPIKVTP